MNADERSPIIAQLFRGGFIETEHRGMVAVADASGRILRSCGDPSVTAALRSSAKPFQAAAVVESGAADRFGFTAPEIAVMAGSHAGRVEHVAAVRSILEKAGLSPDHLRCGAHVPFDGDAAEALARRGELPSSIHNNCSGKHAGMLALAAHLGAPLDSYLSPGHPAQRAILDFLGWAAGVAPDSIGLATDGCSAPTFFISVAAAATAFARLAADGNDSRGLALSRVRSAMTSHPEMVGGPGRFDTSVMAAMTNVCAKGGAEGFQGLGCRTSGGESIGVAVKVWDGAGRAAGPAALEALRQTIGSLPSAVESLRLPLIKNHRGTQVGRIDPVVILSFPD